MDDPSKIQLQESSGVQFSLSFLIQILGTVILAVWGYSQLESRIKQLEHAAETFAYKIETIETNINDNQDKPIPSDYIQDTMLSAHAGELASLRGVVNTMELRIYEHCQEE
jgi:hypothetical protein|tara:strand:+ start:2355 stop:2687 length:333 start_codon:yes stop_codon:yes gene_type:complete